LFTGKKGKFILKSAMQQRLRKKSSTSQSRIEYPWADYFLKSPAFKDELESFSRSQLFDMPYFDQIDSRKLIANLKNGEKSAIAYIMPLFMMHYLLAR
jgi:asparagine synthase (glutamine-hydrolysing)